MKRFMALLITIIFFAGAGYHFYTVISLNEKIKALRFQKSISLELESDTSKDSLDYYKKLSLRGVSLLSEEQLLDLAKMEWNYKLLINGEEFKGQNIKIDGNSMEIVLIEDREKNSVLPEDLRLKGKLNSYFKQISLESRIEPEITNRDEEYSTSIIYKFYKLTSGDKIKISLSEELSKRIGLNNKNYVINIQ